MKPTTGDKIKYYRVRSKLSQFELEVEIAASNGSISRLENDLINPTKETLLKIANVLGLDFNEKVNLLGLTYSEVERYIPERLLKQKLTNNIGLDEIINTNFMDFAFVKGKDYFIKECDSSLDVQSNEVFYLQNIYSWRKGYSEEEANTQHVPKRMHMKKFAKFLINDCDAASKFQERDTELFRESRLIKSKTQFDYTLMIEQDRITIFFTEPNINAFTVKNEQVVKNARNVFNTMWEENKL